jgi:hypothetical protein
LSLWPLANGADAPSAPAIDHALDDIPETIRPNEVSIVATVKWRLPLRRGPGAGLCEIHPVANPAAVEDQILNYGAAEIRFVRARDEMSTIGKICVDMQVEFCIRHATTLNANDDASGRSLGDRIHIVSARHVVRVGISLRNDALRDDGNAFSLRVENVEIDAEHAVVAASSRKSGSPLNAITFGVLMKILPPSRIAKLVSTFILIDPTGYCK